MNDNQNKIPEELKEIWNLTKIEHKNLRGDTIESYVVKEDVDCFIKPEDLSYYFQTHILPQPFFGNLVDPKIIILALNPRYSSKASEEECVAVLNHPEINNDYKKYIENIDKVFSVKDGSTLEWWKKTFKGLFDKRDVNLQKILKNVAIFNYCGYHSISYNDLPQGVVNTDDGSKLPTESAILKYVSKLIEDKDIQPVVIKLWGDVWNPVLDKLPDNELKQVLYVNAKCGSNRYIIDGLCKNKQVDFKKKFINEFEYLCDLDTFSPEDLDELKKIIAKSNKSDEKITKAVQEKIDKIRGKKASMR